MKKLLCFLLCSVLIFSSISFCFAQDWSSTDSQNLSNAASRLQTIITTLQTTNSTLNIISNRVLDIKNALFDDNHSVAYWVAYIHSWMSPIYNSLTSTPLDLNIIKGLLGYPTTVEGQGTTWNSYLHEIFNGTVNAPSYTFSMNNNAGGYIDTFNLSSSTNPIKDLPNYAYWLLWTQMTINNKMVDFGSYLTTSYGATQNAVNWGNLGTSSFTPVSTTDGLYKWLSAIQAPVARLSYVLASDERIEAQEAAAANEEAVVNNFIDSTGDGAASPSDIGSVSGLSSGYKQNFGSDASPTGIFDIFNSDHATWFSQETKNQLDTTTPTRLTKGSQSETPLLDKQIEDIYDALGVKQP